MATKTATKKVKTPKLQAQPGFHTQLAYNSEQEQVPADEYVNKIACAVQGCKNIRWVKNQDAHQVTMCKPHQRRAQRRHRAEKRKERRAAARGTVVRASRAAQKRAHTGAAAVGN